MFYIILGLIILIFIYAMFLDNKNKKQIEFTKESENIDFSTSEKIKVRTDKKRYHFKTAFIGITLKNNTKENIEIDNDFDLEVKKDDTWYTLDVEKYDLKKISLKPDEDYYQNIFIDAFKDLDKYEARIIKKVFINNELLTYQLPIILHHSKAIKE